VKIKKPHLKFIAGKDNKVYLRYFATIEKGIGKTFDKPIDVKLSKDDILKLNANNLGGMVQKECNSIKADMVNNINLFYAKTNLYPTPDQLRTYNNAIYSVFDIDYHINQFYKSLTIKPSSITTYGYTLRQFKQYFIMNLLNYTVNEMINQTVINEFGKWLVTRRKAIDKIVKKDISKISIYNQQMILFKFLNYVAKEYDLSKIDDFLSRPHSGQKYHISEEDFQRILKFEPTSLPQKEVLDIIRINRYVGLRIGEILTIDKRNIKINDVCEIEFKEHKKDRPRTVVIVDKEAIDIIRKYCDESDSYLWSFHHHNWFNTVLRDIAKKVFKEEKVEIYKNRLTGMEYAEVLKYKAISSHSFRRFAIERNIVKYGIDVARQFSGHSDTAIVFKHYADWMKAEDLKSKLLGK